LGYVYFEKREAWRETGVYDWVMWSLQMNTLRRERLGETLWCVERGLERLCGVYERGLERLWCV